MKKIIAVNGSPRKGWNTDLLLQQAVKGAEEMGAEVEVIDLYKLERFTGCISCFGCKREKTYGRCIAKDALSPVLEKIRTADGLIIGSPNYLGDVTAVTRALYERLVFQSLTYRKEMPCCNERLIPVLMLMTCNAPAEFYTELLEKYAGTLGRFVGPTRTFIAGNTLQVKDYTPFNWTMFDPEAKKARRETIFPNEMAEVRKLGQQLAEGW